MKSGSNGRMEVIKGDLKAQTGGSKTSSWRSMWDFLRKHGHELYEYLY